MFTSKNFIAHLLEVRTRLLYSFGALLVIFIGFLPWAADLYTLLAHPLLAKLPNGGQMIAIGVITPFFVPIKVALMAAFLVALPYIMYQAWSFIAPGLYAHEKRMTLPLVMASTTLFYCGMSFAYFAVFPIMFGFIVGSAPEGVAVMTDISEYLSFVLSMFMAFGIAFQVPVVVVVLVKMNLVTIAKLREIRPYIIVGAFVVGAIFTPPDVISQFMLAIPMWLLYEAGIVVAVWMTKSVPKKSL